MRAQGRILDFATLAVMYVLSTAMAATPQEYIPTIAEILDKVQESTIPQAEHVAEVEQTIHYLNKVSGATAAEETAMVETYSLTLGAQGFRVAPKLRGGDGKGVGVSQKARQPGFRVLMNPVQTLQNMLEWDVEVLRADHDGRPCYSIRGENGGPLSSVVLVDRERWCVYRVQVKMKDRLVIDALAKYSQKDSGLCIPERIVITHPTEGLEITQQFGQFVASE
jgi:hypothetical protein